MRTAQSVRSSRFSVAPTEGGETWYDCIEEGVGLAMDYPRFSIHDSLVPLLFGQEGQDMTHAGSEKQGPVQQLLGQTVPRMEKEDRPDGFKPTWSPADAAEFEVRQGPNYPSTGLKEAS